jgi:hypothetical protein
MTKLTVEGVRQILAQLGGNTTQAAEALGVSRGSLYYFRKTNGLLGDESAAEPLEATETEVRTMRKLESTAARVKDELKLEKKKRQQAEADLATMRSNLEAATDAFSRSRPAKLSKSKSRNGSGAATAIICATDWHAEGKVDAELLNGVNEFNLDICSARIKRLWEKSIHMVDFAKHLSKICEQVLWLGGDLVNGAIHEELEEGNFLGPADAVLFVQDHVAAGIDKILRELPGHLTVATNQGNHGRTTLKKRISTGYLHSWEYLAYSNLQRIYRNNPRVTFKIAKGYHNILELQGHKVRFHHGDALKGGGGIGGITVPARKKIAQWNKQERVLFDVFGHFHQFIDMWDMVTIGCLIGYNEYALELACDFQEPTQALIVVDKSHGKVLATPIFVQETN